MTTMIKQLSLATIGAAALAVGTMTPAYAALITLPISGLTGGVTAGDPATYPEYQDAFFEGTFTYDNSVNLSNVALLTRYAITRFDITVTNPFSEQYSDFMATITRSNGSVIEIDRRGAVPISSLLIPKPAPDGAQNVSNESTNDPRKAGLFLSFAGIFNDPTNRTTYIPGGVLDLFDAQKPDCFPAGPATIDVKYAEVGVEAVPEPTTMAGLGVFGLGALLRKKMKKQAA